MQESAILSLDLFIIYFDLGILLYYSTYYIIIIRLYNTIVEMFKNFI